MPILNPVLPPGALQGAKTPQVGAIGRVEVLSLPGIKPTGQQSVEARLDHAGQTAQATDTQQGALIVALQFVLARRWKGSEQSIQFVLAVPGKEGARGKRSKGFSDCHGANSL